MSSVRSRWCLVGSVFAALVVGALVAVLVLQPWSSPDHPRYPRAVVAANGIECAAIGRSILERNGTAVDAAIATLFCEGLGCSQCMGLGGGFLATVYDAPTGRVRVLNARERAPAATYSDMFANASSQVGGRAIAVPGGIERLRRALPRIRPIALEGAGQAGSRPRPERTPRQRIYGTRTQVLQRSDSRRTVFQRSIHEPSNRGALVRDIENFGGIITEDDFRNYRTEWQEPIVVRVSPEHTLYSVPLPGSGSVLAFILNMLREWVGTGSDAPVDSNLYWHRIVETFKFAYARRTGLGDPSRTNLPFSIAELERNLSTPEWAVEHRAKVDDTRTFSDWRYYGAMFEGADDHGTAHIIVVAPDGSAVSATSTINYIWGSQRRSRSTGIILNNEMDDFAIPNRESVYGMPPSPANIISPGKQPLSSMAPSIVLRNNDTVDLILGGAGGTKITTQVALLTMHTLLEDSELPEVMKRPRLHHQLIPMEIEYEEKFDPAVISSLRARGHVTTSRGPTAGFAAMVAAMRDSGDYFVPQTDSRRIGSVDGF
ncbi:unnamed protein product [Pieris macdunnoughi]|uniref:Uncharacterized protein n=1 Tax=Pieris macdunnoughi TaxID=345717 RepID=A0A821X0T7_9NEOP|nr:unnamed protein product [Pieris macdunnoughi]